MKSACSFHRFLWLVSISILFSSCSLRITEKSIRKHYANEKIKPVVQIIENDSLRIRVASMGPDSLPMLLLIHGAPGAWWGYLNMLDDPDLQKKFHIVSVDRMGYGKSRLKNLKHVTSIEKQAACLLQVLQLNKSTEKVMILGRSYGAPIAAAMTVMEPEKFKELVMVSPVIDPDLERFYWFSGIGKSRFVQWMLPQELNIATAEKYAHVEELKQISYIWQKISIPTTVITGGKDWIADPGNIVYARRNILAPGVQFISLPSAGHMITFSHKNLIKSMLLKSGNYRSKNITIDITSQLTFQNQNSEELQY